MANEKKIAETESKLENVTTPVAEIFAGLMQDDISTAGENPAPQPAEEKKNEDYTAKNSRFRLKAWNIGAIT